MQHNATLLQIAHQSIPREELIVGGASFIGAIMLLVLWHPCRALFALVLAGLAAALQRRNRLSAESQDFS